MLDVSLLMCMVADAESQLVTEKRRRKSHELRIFTQDSSELILKMKLTDFSNNELTDMHLMYGRAFLDRTRARQLYAERFPNRPLPEETLFEEVHNQLMQTGSFDGTADDSLFGSECLLNGLTFAELTNMHLMYGAADMDPQRASELYAEYFLNKSNARTPKSEGQGELRRTSK